MNGQQPTLPRWETCEACGTVYQEGAEHACEAKAREALREICLKPTTQAHLIRDMVMTPIRGEGEEPIDPRPWRQGGAITLGDPVSRETIGPLITAEQARQIGKQYRAIHGAIDGAERATVPAHIRIAEALTGEAFRYANEAHLHALIAERFIARGIEYRHEFTTEEGRCDFVVENTTVVEVKISGSRGSVLRQLGRYARLPWAEAVVLLTTRTRHRMPPRLNGKPVYVLNITKGQGL